MSVPCNLRHSAGRWKRTAPASHEPATRLQQPCERATSDRVGRRRWHQGRCTIIPDAHRSRWSSNTGRRNQVEETILQKVVTAALGCLLIGMSASPAVAQAPSGSRLDDVIKNGKLRVCTPGDYKPFSFQKPNGGYEGPDIDMVQAAATGLADGVLIDQSG